MWFCSFDPEMGLVSAQSNFLPVGQEAIAPITMHNAHTPLLLQSASRVMSFTNFGHEHPDLGYAGQDHSQRAQTSVDSNVIVEKYCAARVYNDIPIFPF